MRVRTDLFPLPPSAERGVSAQLVLNEWLDSFHSEIGSENLLWAGHWSGCQKHITEQTKISPYIALIYPMGKWRSGWFFVLWFCLVCFFPWYPLGKLLAPTLIPHLLPNTHSARRWKIGSHFSQKVKARQLIAMGNWIYANRGLQGRAMNGSVSVVAKRIPPATSWFWRETKAFWGGPSTPTHSPPALRADDAQPSLLHQGTARRDSRGYHPVTGHHHKRGRLGKFYNPLQLLRSLCVPRAGVLAQRETLVLTHGNRIRF